MHNEQLGARECVERVIAELKKLKLPSKLIVINDGSKDNTKKILKALKKKYAKWLTVVTHPKNKGYGAGLQTGIQQGLKQKFEFCVFMDSDLTNDPSFLKQFAKHCTAHYDCVKASRFIKGGGMVDVPLYRRIASWTANYFASGFFGLGIHDCTNGFRMVRLQLLKDVQFKEKGFAIILEELYELRRRDAVCTEIPNILRNRKHGKTHFSYNFKTLWSYAKYALKASVLS